MPDDHGGFEDVRETLDGHPMVSLLAYARPYWPRVSLGVAAAFCTRFARLVPPILVATAIDRIINGPAEPGLLARVRLLPAEPIVGAAARTALLERLVAIAALAYVVRSLTRFGSRYLLQSAAQKIQRDLRNDTYDHLQHLSMDFFVDHQTGGMMSVLNSDINRLEQFLNTEFRQLIRVVATVGGIAVVLWTYSPKLAAIALAPVPIIGVASGRFLTWIEPRYKSIREAVARLNTRLENNLGGAAVIKTFNRYGFERDRVAERSQDYHDEKVAALRIRRAFFAALRLLTGVVFVLVLYVGGMDNILGVEGALTAGSFALFFLYLRRLYSPMRRVGKSANKYQLAKSSAERVFGLLGREPTITSPDDPYRPDGVDGDVTFDDVTFSYGDREPVVRNVSLDVPAGTTVGLAGATGAGKSTLLKLVPRFHGVDSGSVRIDGVDVREYDLDALREEIAIVEQNPYLFSGTVAENIAYGDRDALAAERRDDDAARDRVIEAASAAEAHGFVTDLPDGYDTFVGERGVKLSGGQRQRLAIARALLNDPAIIVFDEATSDVDTETEELIQESLDRLIEDRTAFVIAHRLSTIRDADRIVVLEDGEIVESGTHADLLADDGDYAALWNAQADAQRIVDD
ncbi:ABC transporter ATP-binding protein [Haloplanus aerogenes]|uniref:ABC transporter ATP-binding protein n=1 Tax=Haloplanus aerogenes TaxID=660522 RepID=A0A3M0CEG9_9EURY|nr:ABC transporter ATP-binding protein [Haloplanus aerogenes]AZH24140.1 ABC transporter ATP-binding protein [Haloplanus aerogenes]RMB08221.1 ATP-binding cassette subfamily B protein [Haloplanus aerogenes]